MRILRLTTALGATTATNRCISLNDLPINGLFTPLFDFRGMHVGRWNRIYFLHMHRRVRILGRKTPATMLRKLTADGARDQLLLRTIVPMLGQPAASSRRVRGHYLRLLAAVGVGVGPWVLAELWLLLKQDSNRYHLCSQGPEIMNERGSYEEHLP